VLLTCMFILILALALANGSNDVSKSVATLVGSGVTDYHKALRWGTAWTVIGAFLGGVFGLGLAERFAKSLGADAGQHVAIPLAVVVAAFAWVTFASRTGLPVSTTHAISGAILGVGWVAHDLAPWTRMDVLQGFFVPLLASPVMAVALTFALRPGLVPLGRWLDARLRLRCPGSVSHPRGIGR
jgi:PiT family inorganic phosphate transporter